MHAPETQALVASGTRKTDSQSRTSKGIAAKSDCDAEFGGTGARTAMLRTENNGVAVVGRESWPIEHSGDGEMEAHAGPFTVLDRALCLRPSLTWHTAAFHILQFDRGIKAPERGNVERNDQQPLIWLYHFSSLFSFWPFHEGGGGGLDSLGIF